ncbi:MAG TPA: hypothetical protein V6D03_05985, partial [Candidatus Caenarcaniphilales bacterium]
MSSAFATAAANTASIVNTEPATCPTESELLPEATGVYITVHGHFYQPPREHPSLEVIERQPSAAPFHNWNERIH